ncbi:MAG: 30S ribosomal protein S9 [Myxococcales bacterium]|nr:30S ribosomal protein S9 [Myxococcales bacterium]
MNPIQRAIEALYAGERCPRLRIDVTHEGVVCPDFVRERWKEQLIIDLDPSYPLDLAFTKVGVEADLSFGGHVSRCVFPWTAIYLVADRETGKGQVFQEHIPAALRQGPAPAPKPKAGGYFWGTGRRKTAIARVWLMPGEGKITINRRDAEHYLTRPTNMKFVEQPLYSTDTREKYDVWATAKGGGLSGQAGAVRLGIARALLRVNGEYRGELKSAGQLTRDPRKKERKKYGRRGARARFQFSKR